MSTILGLLHNPSNSLQAHTKTMAPSSNQASTTPNKTNPDLRLTLESPNSPPLTPSLNNHSPTPQTYEQEMEMLEQLWSGLSLEHTFEGTVSYVRIPVHPRTAMQWNQMTQTPSLPLRLNPPPPPPTPTPLAATVSMSGSTGPATLLTPRQGNHEFHRSGSGAPRRAPPVQPPWTLCPQPFSASWIKAR